MISILGLAFFMLYAKLSDGNGMDYFVYRGGSSIRDFAIIQLQRRNRNKACRYKGDYSVVT